MGSLAFMRLAVARPWPNMRRVIGLTLEEGKHLLAALQVHLVQAQAEDHSHHRRRCQRCGTQRPLKDQRSRRLVSLFGTVEVRAPRFTPCRCAVTCRRTLNPVAEIMPDRCTPEYERTVAKMGTLLPYRRTPAFCPPPTRHRITAWGWGHLASAWKCTNAPFLPSSISRFSQTGIPPYYRRPRL